MNCQLSRCLGDDLLGIARILEQENNYLKKMILDSNDFNSLNLINIQLEYSLLKIQEIYRRLEVA